jgi:hypothetical protein
MTNETRIWRHAVTLAFGLIMAGIIGRAIAMFSSVAGVVVFALLSLFWIISLISFARHQVWARGGTLGLFADPQHWTPHRLPLEFRFITHDTLMQHVLDKLGPSSTRPPIPHGALRYDWPDGRIIFVHPESSASRSRRVRAIQVYDEPSDIPIGEII